MVDVTLLYAECSMPMLLAAHAPLLFSVRLGSLLQSVAGAAFFPLRSITAAFTTSSFVHIFKR